MRPEDSATIQLMVWERQVAEAVAEAGGRMEAPPVGPERVTEKVWFPSTWSSSMMGTAMASSTQQTTVRCYPIRIKRIPTPMAWAGIVGITAGGKSARAIAKIFAMRSKRPVVQWVAL